jgi:hypothetical protein
MTPTRKLAAVPNELPHPPYPADLRARGFTFPLDWELLEQSKTWKLTQDRRHLRPWLMMLWAVSWKNAPCGSFDDDDEDIALSIGMDLPTFQANREVLMRGWVRHSDGRLYHTALTKIVLAMADKREKDRARVATHRARQKAAAEELRKTPAKSDDVTRDIREPTQDTPATSREFTTGQDSTGDTGPKPSAPNGAAAAAAPIEPPPETVIAPSVRAEAETIFAVGLPLLMKAGIEEKQARGFLGYLRKKGKDRGGTQKAGDVLVVDAINRCVESMALAPMEFLQGCFKDPPLPRHGPASKTAMGLMALEDMKNGR